MPCPYCQHPDSPPAGNVYLDVAVRAIGWTRGLMETRKSAPNVRALLAWILYPRTHECVAGECGRPCPYCRTERPITNRHPAALWLDCGARIASIGRGFMLTDQQEQSIGIMRRMAYTILDEQPPKLELVEATSDDEPELETRRRSGRNAA